MRAYPRPMSIRKLFAFLVALAVLVMPSVTFASMPAAMAHDHTRPMMEMGHCQMPPSKSGDHGKADRNCCISMCMAIAVTPDAPAGAVEPEHVIAYFTVPLSWRGHLSEIATPPPRAA